MAKKKDTQMPEMIKFPSIRLGSEGSYVTVVQANLINRGYDLGEGKIDGHFGEKTRDAVKAFQKSVGMAVPNGIVGPRTWKALQETPFPQISDFDHKPEIKIEPVNIQQFSTIKSSSEDYLRNSSSCKVIIEGLSKIQAEIIVRLFDGGFLCRII